MHPPRHTPAFHLALATLPLALGAIFASQGAQASGFQLKENSAQALGRAFAGSAAVGDDASVVVNNPAAMDQLRGPVFQADVTAINFSTHFSGSGTDAIGQPLTGGNGGDGGTTKPVPALFFAMPVGDRWRVGAAVTAPFGFVTDYNDGWIGRYEALKSEVQSIAITLSASYALSDQFSIGASVISQRTKAELSSAVNFGTLLYGPTQGQILPQQLDGHARIKGDNWAWGWQLGLLWKPTDADRIGFNYRSKIDHTLTGDANFTVPALASQINPAFGTVIFADTRGRADFTTPYSATLSWWHTLEDRFSFGADVAYTHWSTLQQLRVTYANPNQPDSVEVFDWKNTLFASLGAEYRLDPAWTLRGGIAIDGTPTQEQTRDPRVPDGTRRWVTVGAGYQPSPAMTFNAGFAHLFVSDGHVSGSTSATGDRLIGDFSNKGNLLGVSGQFRF